jgi:Bacteriophage protein of unknown function (DUF646).
MLRVDIDDEIDVNAADVLQAHRDRIRDAADLGFSISQERVPFERGTLKDSGFPPEFRGDDIVFGYTADYAEDMEYGTEPHNPPTAPLVEWAERVAGDPGLGYYVANEKIPREGVDAQPYLRPAFDRMKPYLENQGLDL